MRAIEPPPAPISIMSTTGATTGSPDPRLNRWTRAASIIGAIAGRPPRTRQILAVVPPMSKATRSRRPNRSPKNAVTSAPPAGPDSRRRIGNRRAVSHVAVPPDDCIR